MDDSHHTIFQDLMDTIDAVHKFATLANDAYEPGLPDSEQSDYWAGLKQQRDALIEKIHKDELRIAEKPAVSPADLYIQAFILTRWQTTGAPLDQSGNDATRLLIANIFEGLAMLTSADPANKAILSDVALVGRKYR